MKKHILKITFGFVFCIFALAPFHAHALIKKGGKGALAGGSFSVGFGVGITTADQSGLNNMINASKNAVQASTSTFGSALEFMAHFTYRLSNNLVAFQLRPTYFQQSVSGSGTDGSHTYDLTGYTVFPLVRLIPLSNDVIDFYLQAGLGYGKLDGYIANGARKANFSGSSFGMQAGLGADFCLIPQHCFGIEGNYRYLPIVRNIVSSGTGPGAPVYGATQAEPGKELEDSSFNDVATSLTGISGILTYTFNF